MRHGINGGRVELDTGTDLSRSALAFRVVWLALAALIGVAPGAGAQVNADDIPLPVNGALDAHLAARPLAAAVRVDVGMSIDGRLDEGVWRNAIPLTDFTQTDPFEGQAATDRTEVRFLYDDEALYVGARMWETTGDVKQRLGRRDSFLMDSDWFQIALDTHHDHVSAYKFSINPAGVKRDEVEGAGGPGGSGVSWDAVWDAVATVDEEGWTAEIRIPFSQLRYGRSDSQVWGIQVARRAIGREETVIFAFTPKSERGGVSRFGHLVGLQGLLPGRRFEALPYVVSRAEYLDIQTGNPYRDGSDMYAGAGLDLKYRLTSAMTLDATFNPDFGQVEQDPAEVNLSAFETSFDEKRPFFVEGADIFQFNGLRLFYSRRIGRQPQGSLPSDVAHSNRPDNSTILGASKLTGRTRTGWNLGLVQAVTARESAEWVDDGGGAGSTVVEPVTSYVAARAEKNMREGQTQIGGIMTAVNRNLADETLTSLLRSSAYTGGLDFSHEMFNRSWRVSGYFASSRINGSADAVLRAQLSSARYFQRPDADYLSIDSAATSMEGWAGRLAINKVAGMHWRGDANVSVVSPGFEINDLGFQTTVDRFGTDINVTYVENQPNDLFRNYRFNLRNAGDWNFGGDRIEARSTLSFNYTLANYWGGQINYTHGFASYNDRLTRGGPVAYDPAGNRAEVQLNTDSRRPISLRSTANYSWGGSGGWHTALSGNVSVRPAENWSFSVGPRLNRSLSTAQYIGSIEDPAAIATYGRRYIFSSIEQTTLSVQTRVNVNLTPGLSFEVYAEPFVSTGEYGDPRQLTAPRTYDFEPYTDGEVSRSDFTTRSLRGNAVMRWEWRPGSTLFAVWQQRRSGSDANGDFDFGRDAGAIFDQRPENVFLVKVNYWLNF
jgi:hypothetical protein